MFDRFTTQARTALALSQTEAQNAGAGAIGPVHLALACLSQPASDAVQLVEALNLAAALVSDAIAPMPVASPSQDLLPMDSGLKQVLTTSMRLAMESQRTMVTSAHLMAAIVSVDPNGDVARELTESHAGQLTELVASIPSREVIVGDTPSGPGNDLGP